MKKTVLTILTNCAAATVVLLLLLGLVVYFGGQKAALLAKPPEHGTSFVVDFTPASNDTNVLGRLKETICQRFDRFGLRIYWESVSESRFRIVVPTVDQKNAVIADKLISQGGHLAFRLVHEHSDQLVTNGDIPAGYELLVQQQTHIPPGGSPEKVVVKKEPEAGLAGNIIKRASVASNPTGQSDIDFELTPDSTIAFAQVTRTNIGRRLAIVLDGDLYSAPVIQGSIENGYGRISGSFDGDQALLLTISINYPLPVPVTVVSKSF